MLNVRRNLTDPILCYALTLKMNSQHIAKNDEAHIEPSSTSEADTLNCTSSCVNAPLGLGLRPVLIIILSAFKWKIWSNLCSGEGVPSVGCRYWRQYASGACYRNWVLSLVPKHPLSIIRSVPVSRDRIAP